MSELVSVAVPPLGSPLTYRVPDELREQVQVGHRVTVPLGNRRASGFVVLDETGGGSPELQIKSIFAPDGAELCFSPDQLPFFNWVAEYYGDSLANVLDVAVPAKPPERKTRLLTLDPEATGENKKLGKAQRRVIEVLREYPHGLDQTLLIRRIPGAHAALRSLTAGGTVKVTHGIAAPGALHDQAPEAWAKTEVELNPEQQAALSEIEAALIGARPEAFLLHGITGSGKTEVYIEAVIKALELGRGSLIVVPEIALTPQLIERFRARLGDRIAVLHSGLNKRTRWESWQALIAGRVQIAIGARSAIFAPVRNLGLIIVDEEHDSSFKQGEGLRYHARDLAFVRSRMQSCPVVFGSATPSLEMFYRAFQKKCGYLKLVSRHQNARMPSVELVDLNLVKPWEMLSRNVSPRLFEGLRDTLARGEQAFILYNRRGFASYLQCEKCEYTCECPNCSVTLTYHQKTHSLICHYCSYTLPPATYCPQCAAGRPDAEKPARLTHRGAGTEKVFDELRELFPAVSMDRLDRDAATTLDQYRDVLARVRSGETRVLIGTQMIAKGHDLPEVTFVGVADCDVGLHMPDFRAAERVFQLLTQASGRAGRAERPGSVVLQTRMPQHPSLQMTVTQDYKGFAKLELQARRQSDYPPFTRLLRIVALSPDKDTGLDILREFRGYLEKLAEKTPGEFKVLGPAPAPIERIRGDWRWHLLIKSKSATALNRILRVLKPAVPKSKKIRCVFDLDPQEML